MKLVNVGKETSYITGGMSRIDGSTYAMGIEGTLQIGYPAPVMDMLMVGVEKLYRNAILKLILVLY